MLSKRETIEKVLREYLAKHRQIHPGDTVAICRLAADIEAALEESEKAVAQSPGAQAKAWSREGDMDDMLEKAVDELVISRLHQIAMEHADSGDILGAFHAERIASLYTIFPAEQLEPPPEPTRSVLLRSAATLGCDAGRWAEAKRLAQIGLDGNPPEPIRQELEEVLARIEQSASSVEHGG